MRMNFKIGDKVTTVNSKNVVLRLWLFPSVALYTQIELNSVLKNRAI